jgi:2-(1,2-epoxy-1,2-dihydrophenyl)acetyl-CoA isomerase
MPRVLSELREGVATLTLNMPERMNPVALELQHELRAALATVRDNRHVRAVVLTGAGKAFCAGADLQSLQPAAGVSLGDQTAEWMQSVSHPLIQDLRNMPVPVVCAVNGAAAGAGAGLAQAADITVAARSAYFYLPFLPRLGIVPDLGSTWFIPRRVGPARAMGMALLDERVSGEQAAQWGLVWAVFDDAELLPQAWQIAHRLAQLPAHAVIEARRALEASAQHSLDQQLHYESERQRELLDGEAFAEGAAAFLQKRKPVFPPR